MKAQIKPLNLALVLSLPFLAAGVFMTASAYHRYMAVEAAAEQLEFLKNLPQAANPGDTLKMPSYTPNTFMEEDGALSGAVTCSYYEGRVSVRLVTVSVRRGPFARTELHCLLDARGRN